MKVLKVLSGIIFAVGLFMIIGEVGTDDFYTMELHMEHSINWVRIMLGFMLLLPAAVIGVRENA